jgi:hypothetical protein
MADIKIGDIAVYEDDDGKAVWEFEGKVQSDIPLDTDAQDFAGAINELKKLSEMGGGDDWQPPESWIEVPEPGPYDIYVLVWVTNTNNSFEINLRNNETDYGGMGAVYCSWGDGTESSYPAEFYWGGSVKHKFNDTGQYLIKIVTSESLNVIRLSYTNYCYWQIIKTGSGLLFFSDAVESLRNSYNSPLAHHSKLKYIKVNNAKGLPFDKINGYFESDSSLKKIELKKQMSGNINNSCFNCISITDLSQISLDGESVISVDKYGFFNCKSLKKIILPNCTEVGDKAFSGCQSLEKIILPNCTEVGDKAFDGCYNLQEIVVAEGCTFGTDCFQYCYSLYPRPDGSIN